MQPLCFEPFLRPMVWGNRLLAERLRKVLPDERPHGESWEVSDHTLHRSVVAVGPHRGRTLRQLMEAHREELLNDAAHVYSQFPWLIKFLDCHDWLSVQVHPDELAVKELLPGEGSKTEAWFILDAAPGARVYAGLRRGVDEAVLRRALAAGTVADCLHSFIPQAGDCVFLPAGTVHAVGGGVLMAEVQQTSDATFRLFDWNRRDAQGKTRELHVEQALRAIHWEYGPVQPMRTNSANGESGTRRLPLVDCPYFRLEYLESRGKFCRKGKRLQALVVVRGSGTISAGATQERVETGQVWVLPAALAQVEIVPHGMLGLLACELPG
jgi:mannose-6-phosphate isomerase